MLPLAVTVFMQLSKHCGTLVELVAELHMRAGRLNVVAQWADSGEFRPGLMEGWGTFARGEIARLRGELADSLPWFLLAVDAAGMPGGPVGAATVAVEVQRLLTQDLEHSLGRLRDELPNGTERFMVERALGTLSPQLLPPSPEPSTEQEMVEKLKGIGACTVCFQSLAVAGEECRIYVCYTREHAVCQG